MEGDMQDKLAQPQLEDTQIVHAAPGEMVVPPVISNTTQELINRDMQAVGLNPQEYVVGNGQINQLTGLQQFGFLSKVFKKIKKVVKKVAPIAIPALGIAGFAGARPLAGFLGKGAAKATTGKIFGAGGKFRAGLSGFFNPAKDTLGIFKGKFGPNIRRGIGGLFRPGQVRGEFEPGNFPGDVQLVSNEQQNYPASNLVQSLLQDGTLRYEQGYDGMPGYLTDGKNKFYSGDEVMSVYGQQTQSRGLGFFRRDPSDKGRTPQIIKSIGDYFGFGGRSGLQDAYGGENAEGSFFGMRTPGPIRGIEDVFKGQQTGDSRGGLAALAALYGLATKRAAEDRVGGLTDIRASRRPDLMAQPVYQGFDLGVRRMAAYGGTAKGRPGFAKGGALNPDLFELDYRQVGGPTIGIGTGTSDDIPAMLSDGEYVFTASANNGAGAFDISKSKDSIMLTPDGKPNREKGAKNLGMLMDMFEDTDKRLS